MRPILPCHGSTALLHKSSGLRSPHKSVTLVEVAPVAQGIEHWFPEPGAQVRILSGVFRQNELSWGLGFKPSAKFFHMNDTFLQSGFFGGKSQQVTLQ